MANKTAKNLKSVSSRTKGMICLVLLLAVTVFVSCISLAGMGLKDAKELMPWVPVSSENWPDSLPLSHKLAGGTYLDYDYSLPQAAAETAQVTPETEEPAEADEPAETEEVTPEAEEPADTEDVATETEAPAEEEKPAEAEEPVEAEAAAAEPAATAAPVDSEALSAALDNSLKAIRARLEAYGETDADVSVKDGKIHLELRNMDASRLSNIQSVLTVAAEFEFSNGNVHLTQKDITGAEAQPVYRSNRMTGYELSLKVSDEARKILKEHDGEALNAYKDGTAFGSGSVIDNGEIKISFSYTESDINTMYDAIFFLRSGAVEVNMTQSGSGKVEATMSGVVKAVLWVAALMLAATLIYTLFTGRLTGVSATISVWCAVVAGLFMVAAVVVPSVMSLSVACLIAILLGIALAAASAIIRTEAVSKQIGEGAMPKAATKMGFKVTAKLVWLAHGAALVLSLILMIFSFTRPTGYCLCFGVLASALSVVIMRAYQACFTAIANKPSLFGKDQ